MHLTTTALPNAFVHVLAAATLLASPGLAIGEAERIPPSLTSELNALEAKADGATVTMDSKGFRVTSADGESSIKIGGRIQADVAVHSPDSTDDGTEFTDGTELRRGRFELKGTLPKNMSWAAEVDFGSNKTSVKDFWLGFDTAAGPKVTLGNQKQPYSLSAEMSSNDIPFIERSVDIFLLVPFVDRAVGVRVQDNSEKLFYAIGAFGQGVSPTTGEDEGAGITGRLVAAPIQSDTSVLHLGVRSSLRVPSDDEEVRIRDQTTNMSAYSVVDTGTITDVDTVALYGVEAVYALGPFSVTGEFNQLAITRMGEDFDFSSWTLESTYSITGESRAKAYRMDSGEFKRLEAEHGKALELAARISNLDLNDGSLSGGAEDVVTVGLNWYTSPNTRFMFDWTRILDTEGGGTATSLAEDTDIFAARVQLTF